VTHETGWSMLTNVQSNSQKERWYSKKWMIQILPTLIIPLHSQIQETQQPTEEPW
jgi:hypothetical protein